MNSLWGWIYQLRKELHMSHYELMWQRSWINIEMMLADQPRMVKKGETLTTGKEAANRWRNRTNKNG